MSNLITAIQALPIPSPTPMPVPFLQQPWWQGVAGIAQIFAGILTVLATLFAWITINQAKEMQKEAKKERKESVRPDVTKIIFYQDQSMYDNKNPERIVYHYKLKLENIGFGPILKPNISFQQQENPDNCEISLAPFDRVIDPYDPFEITIYIKTQPCQSSFSLKGFILIECVSRYGEDLKWKTDLYMDQNKANSSDTKFIERA